MALTKRQRRMMVLPAPHGGLDASDRAETVIFYSFMFFVKLVSLPLRVMFTSPQQEPFFVSNEFIGKETMFVASTGVSASRQVFDATKKPKVFKSLQNKNIFISPRKTS